MELGFRKWLSGFVAVLFFLVAAVPFHAKGAAASSKAVEVLKEADFSSDDEKELKVKKEDQEKEEKDKKHKDDDAETEINNVVIDQ